MSETAPKKIGRYDVLGPLGRGGMGVVYLANDPLLGRKVAVKTILASDFTTEDQDDLLRRLLVEGQRAANLRHPGIVSVLDAMQTGDETYIVMEYVAGGKLSDRMKDRPDHAVTLRILREIAQALDYAHEQGIVHRDIKPDNILLAGSDTVRIADFGIAKSLSRHSVSVGAVGTPHYMSPEQIRNEDAIDGRADQFSLGVIAYSMLTGRKPFDGKSQLAIGQKIVSEDPPKASKVDKSLPPEVDVVLLTALAKDPKNRYTSCVAFIDDLDRAIEGSKVVGHVADGGFPRWVLVAALALLAVGGGVGIWAAVAGYWPPWSAPPLPTFKLVVASRGTPVEAGTHFPAGDSAPGAGDLSATITADHPIPSSLHAELALKLGDKLVDHADLSADPAGMKHTFAYSAPLAPGEYSVLFSVEGVQTGGLAFVIDAPPPPATAALEIRSMGAAIVEGQKINKCDPEYPNPAKTGKPGCLGPGDIVATLKQASDAPNLPGPSASLEWLKDGKPFAPPADLPADGKWLPFSASPRGPEPGTYTAKLTVDGHEVSAMNFTIAAPVSSSGAGRLPGPNPNPGPKPMISKWTMQVVSMDCTLTNGQSFLRDDEKCGGIFRAEDVHVVVQPESVKNPDPRMTVDLRWSKTPPDGGQSRPFGAPVALASSMFGKDISAPAPVTRGAYSIHLFVNDQDIKHFDFEVK